MLHFSGLNSLRICSKSRQCHQKSNCHPQVLSCSVSLLQKFKQKYTRNNRYPLCQQSLISMVSDSHMVQKLLVWSAVLHPLSPSKVLYSATVWLKMRRCKNWPAPKWHWRKLQPTSIYYATKTHNSVATGVINYCKQSPCPSLVCLACSDLLFLFNLEVL